MYFEMIPVLLISGRHLGIAIDISWIVKCQFRTNLESAGVLAVEHADEELEPDWLPEAESQHGDGVGDLLVAVGQVAQTLQEL